MEVYLFISCIFVTVWEWLKAVIKWNVVFVMRICKGQQKKSTKKVKSFFSKNFLLKSKKLFTKKSKKVTEKFDPHSLKLLALLQFDCE